jgi:CRP-like cAMP-binding protein
MRHDQSFLATKVDAFIQLSDAELGRLAALQSRRVRVASGTELVHEGQTGKVAHILHEGWTSCSKVLPDGRRQIITFPLPGDFVGLRSILLRTSDHSFTALTDAIVTPVDAFSIKQIFSELPRLGTAILWAASRDEAMVVEHLVSIGRRNSLQRTAYFLLELYDRLKLVGLATGNEFACPLSQHVLGDALGLSAIHVNRVLRQLRERGLLTFKDRLITIHDAKALKTLAGYESPEEISRSIGY